MPEKLPLHCHVEYHKEFLSPEESKSLFDYICSNSDVTNRVINLANGSEYVADFGTYLFTDDNLTGSDKLPEVW